MEQTFNVKAKTIFENIQKFHYEMVYKVLKAK